MTDIKHWVHQVLGFITITIIYFTGKDTTTANRDIPPTWNKDPWGVFIKEEMTFYISFIIMLYFYKAMFLPM